MSIGNLHGLVRGAINSVNPDIAGTWLVSTGTNIDDAGKSTPTYAAAVPVKCQVQAVVYMFANPDAINRLESKGGDLLKFPQYPRGPARTWLIRAVDEPWTAGNGTLAWARVIVSLQLDPNNPVSQQ